MGIRKKILLGFICIGFILLLSGVVAVFEMTRMNDSISGLLSDNIRSIDAAKRMQQVLYKQNNLVFDYLEGQPSIGEDSLMVDIRQFDDQLKLALGNITVVGEKELLEELSYFYDKYKPVLQKTLADQQIQSENITSYIASYRDAFVPLNRTIIGLMDINQNALAENSVRLENNYYRMIMPAIIAIAVGILMIIFFNYFVNAYFINPVLRIKRGINAFLTSRISYSVNVDTHDEIDKLNEEVKALIDMLKKKESKDFSS